MKIVLQDPRTSMYFDADGGWTKRWQEAMPFTSSERALELVNSGRVGDLQIVLKFPGKRYDVVLQKPTFAQPERAEQENDRALWEVLRPFPNSGLAAPMSMAS